MEIFYFKYLSFFILNICGVKIDNFIFLNFRFFVTSVATKKRNTLNKKDIEKYFIEPIILVL
jgi:hypothetical protein